MIVYHGGSGPIVDEIRTPFFTTTVIEMARSYARQKGWGDGRLTEFNIPETAKIATLADIERATGEHSIVWEGSHPSELFHNSASYHAEYNIAAILHERGFDAVLIHDFGYHDDFREEPTYIILNPNALINAREVERVESR